MNLKKSWHVGLVKNQTRVWQAETAALEERKKIAQIAQERQEEAAIEELQRLAAASGGKAPSINPKVAWMYNGSTSGPGGTSEEQESFLLGKRSVAALLQKSEEAKAAAKPKGNDEFNPAAISAREITVKAGLDPLLAIERQKQASFQKMMDDPAIKAKLRKQIKKEESEKKHRKHRRADDEDRDHRSKRRRHSDEMEDDHHRKHRSHRRRHDSRSRTRSRSPHSHRGKDSRERSKYSSRRDDYEHRRHSHRRSRSPYERSRDDEPRRYRSHSPSRYTSPPRRQDRKDRGLTYPSPPDSQKEKRSSASDEEAERAAKLAAMQSSAAELEESRNRRLAEMEARDKEEQEKEDKQRGRRDNQFVGGLHKQAANVGLEGRLNRGRGGLERLDATF